MATLSLEMSPPRVLVVDDAEPNLVAMKAVLGACDCEVVLAPSGKEALRQLVEREFAVILLDVQMPEMDGFEVARVARKSTRTTPIIFVTAMLETQANIFEGYESGAVDVLFKPVNPHVLQSKVNVFLELHRARRRLADEVTAHERTLAELDAFNYSVSHDLRAPLRHVAGFTKILTEDYDGVLDDEGKRVLSRVVAAAHRMDQLISDLLRLSRISRTQPVIQPLDVGALVTQIVTEMRGTDPERDVEIVSTPSMPARGDEKLLTIAVENLLRNAWKFTSKTAQARIEVGRSRTPDETIYFVKDNGAGFDATQVTKLFAPFQRLHAANEFEGTGIGLAIVQRIIHGHRGRIWAEGSPNRGATFFFTLGE
ncbi:MAG: response regulator [Labilithrix sp.]